MEGSDEGEMGVAGRRAAAGAVTRARLSRRLAYSLPARSFQKGVSFSEPTSSGLLK